MGFCCFLFLCCEASLPRILPVCFAAFAFANIFVFTYKKKSMDDIWSCSDDYFS